ncbi:MAG: hypothetical protein ABDH21_03340 [bacterium]
MKFYTKVLVSLALMGLVLSGCTTDQMSAIESPGDLTKEIKIDTSKLGTPIPDVEEVRKKLASKPNIPEKRETVDLKDPFILKSLKALALQTKEKKKEEATEGKVEEKIEDPEQAQVQKDKASDSINIAEESPMMFNFEGVSVYADQRRAILRHLENNRTYIVKKGDIVGGYTITDITDDSLILVKGMEKLVITKKKK